MHPEGLAQVHITVSDLDRSIEFYRDVLGLDFLFRVEGQPMAFLDCGGVRVYLGEAESNEFRSSPILYYRVRSVPDAHQSLIAAGVSSQAEPHVVYRTPASELWLAFVRDPDGNPVGLMEDRPTS